MQPRLFLLLALLLAITPHHMAVAAAEGILGSRLIAPIRPPSGDYVSLFRSPAPRINQNSASPTLPVVAGTPVSSQTGLQISAGAMCRAALTAAEARHGIPNGLLQAIGIVESGRRDEATGVRQPWPWTVNAEGEPHFFDTKQQAVAWVRQAEARGIRSIDTGCAQVNRKHHPVAFASLEQAFDPAANADYAARFLKELHDTKAGGNWLTAVGYYHSQTPELAEEYRRQVQAAASQGAGPAPFGVALASARDSPSPFGTGGRGLQAAGARPEPGRLLAAPSGTVGRGLDGYRAAPIRLAGSIGQRNGRL
jgi:hypothetical protein